MPDQPDIPADTRLGLSAHDAASDPDMTAASSSPRYLVTLQPSGWQFETSGDTALLTAAQAAGIKLPSSCRNGTCRACLCRLTAGEVGYRIEWPGLSRSEKAEGWTLPCCAYARSELVIDAPDAALC